MNKSTIKTMPLIIGTSEIESAITMFKGQARSLQAKLHLIAASTMSHYFEHGDSTLCLKLIDAMPSSQRKNKLTHWFCKNAGLELVTEGKGKDKTSVFKKRVSYDDVTKELRLQAAIQTPFWKMKDRISEDDAYTFSGLNARVIAMVKSAQKTAKDHGDTLNVDSIMRAVSA